MEDSKAQKITIIVAVIGLIGVIGGAVITNFDKLFSSSNRPVPTATSTPTMASTANLAKNGADAPIEGTAGEFFGALDGNYKSNKNAHLTVVWDKRSFSLFHRNCGIEGTLVQGDGFWKVVVVSEDGMCNLIDGDDIGKEVGKITPEAGALANSGRVIRALVNFEKAGLAGLSGTYEFDTGQ